METPLVPPISRYKIFGGLDPKTWAIVSPLWCTLAYNTGYYSRSVALPSHLSSQDRTSDPSLIENVPWPKKCFFVAMSSTEKCESPGFQKTFYKAFEPTYFRLRSVCQIPSSVNNLKSHFPRRDVFLISRSWIPSPPWSFGWHTALHLASLYFFFSLSPCQGNLD
jgi:hypothetical protein